MSAIKRVLVTGGAGYVGSRLVPKLLAAGIGVNVLDLYLYGKEPLAAVRDDPMLTEIIGDLRDPSTVAAALSDCDAVVHLACISNDPSFELDPQLGRSINYDAFRPLVRAAKDHGVTRFIYASSSSVYGLKDEPDVTEDMPLEPLTDYSKYKALCEDVLNEERDDRFHTLIIRPATVCGYAPRLRLDLTVNILTTHAVNNGKIRVFGGSQLRPNIHIEDMTDLYLQCLQETSERIDGKTFNAGYENRSVMEIAEMVRTVVGNSVDIAREATDDLRSYHISSKLIETELEFRPRHTIPGAVEGLAEAFTNNAVPDAMHDPRYYNIRTMQEVDLR